MLRSMDSAAFRGLAAYKVLRRLVEVAVSGSCVLGIYSCDESFLESFSYCKETLAWQLSILERVVNKTEVWISN